LLSKLSRRHAPENMGRLRPSVVPDAPVQMPDALGRVPECAAGSEHCLAGCDSSLGITVSLYPLYSIDLLGHSSLTFEDMALSQRARVFSCRH
jgi:hypothetical protein